MSRVLVWPWHGRLQGGGIRLNDGSVRSHPMPPDQVTQHSGPGDTHLIEVADINPITPAEALMAPDGGEWWAGRALLSGTMLYGKELRGWIYQAPSGGRWWLKLQNVVVGASSTTGQIVSRRFGAIGVSPEVKTHAFTLAAGRASGADAAKVFADQRSSPNGVLRLHSVSATGRHAILALVTYQNAAVTPLDKRPRAYRFFLASVTGEGEGLEVSISLLYGIDDIAPAAESSGPSGFVRIIPAQRGEELERVPEYTDGELTSYRVTYAFQEASGFEPIGTQTLFTKPGLRTNRYRRMLMVRFDGETPVPGYIELQSTCTVPEPSLTRETIEPIIVREFVSGGQSTIQAGVSKLVGSTSVTGTVTLSWSGAGSWSKVMSGSVNSTVDDTTVSNSYSTAAGSGVVSGLSLDRMGPAVMGQLTGNGVSRQPEASVSMGQGSPGNTLHAVALDLYSNNLVGLVERRGETTQEYLGGLSPAGFQPPAGDEAAPALTNYGSYNPATDEQVIGSLTPVNWI